MSHCLMSVEDTRTVTSVSLSHHFDWLVSSEHASASADFFLSLSSVCIRQRWIDVVRLIVLTGLSNKFLLLEYRVSWHRWYHYYVSTSFHPEYKALLMVLFKHLKNKKLHCLYYESCFWIFTIVRYIGRLITALGCDSRGIRKKVCLFGANIYI